MVRCLVSEKVACLILEHIAQHEQAVLAKRTPSERILPAFFRVRLHSIHMICCASKKQHTQGAKSSTRPADGRDSPPEIDWRGRRLRYTH